MVNLVQNILRYTSNTQLKEWIVYILLVWELVAGEQCAFLETYGKRGSETVIIRSLILSKDPCDCDSLWLISHVENVRRLLTTDVTAIRKQLTITHCNGRSPVASDGSCDIIKTTTEAAAAATANAENYRAYTTDAESSTDGASSTDAGSSTDGASTADAESSTDGASTADAGSSTGGASTADAESSTDGASTTDAGSSTDGASTADAESSTDGASTADAESSTDGASTADAESSTDGASTADAESSTDGASTAQAESSTDGALSTAGDPSTKASTARSTPRTTGPASTAGQTTIKPTTDKMESTASAAATTEQEASTHLETTSPQECNAYLLKNGDIPDEDFRTFYFTTTPPFRAWLDSPSAWIAFAGGFAKPWVQVDIGYQTTLNGVITQGYNDEGGYGAIWVTSLKISTYETPGSAKVYPVGEGGNQPFQANTDVNTHVELRFADPVDAQVLRIEPQEMEGRAWGIRFEILGCQ